ncbi:MAG: YbbR-like domain-containing protein [Candidatus Eisenbacteria sp.]|nr:YbbR-like domain-containing protein [Candidatus Eisenbacteria bacterium]
MWHWLCRYVFQNAGIKLVALALALTLYVHVFFSQQREIVMEVPLITQGVPDSLIALDDIPSTAKVRFRGLGLDLLRLRAPSHASRLLLKMEGVGTGRYLRPLVTKDVIVPSEADIQVVEVVSPRVISVEFDRLLNRRLGIVPSVTGRPAPGFIRFGRVSLEPDSVDVRGPRQRLRSFEFLRTEPLDISGCDESVVRQVALHNPPDCEVEPSAVTFRISIEKVISRTFMNLPVKVHHTGDVRLTRMAPAAGSVVVTGPAALADSLTAEDLRLSIDARGLPSGTYTLMASVELVWSLKAGEISVEPVEPTKFEVVLE